MAVYTRWEVVSDAEVDIGFLIGGKVRAPVAQLIAIANPNLGLQTSPNAKVFSDNKVTIKHQSCPENPHRRMCLTRIIPTATVHPPMSELS